MKRALIKAVVLLCMVAGVCLWFWFLSLIGKVDVFIAVVLGAAAGYVTAALMTVASKNDPDR